MCKPEVVGTDGDVEPGVVDDRVGGDVVPTDVVTMHMKPYIFTALHAASVCPSAVCHTRGL